MRTPAGFAPKLMKQSVAKNSRPKRPVLTSRVSWAFSCVGGSLQGQDFAGDVGDSAVAHRRDIERGIPWRNRNNATIVKVLVVVEAGEGAGRWRV